MQMLIKLLQQEVLNHLTEQILKLKDLFSCFHIVIILEAHKHSNKKEKETDGTLQL